MYRTVHHNIMINGNHQCSLNNMNYLAHAYLSFRDPGILTGNMISDYVKGKKKFDYPPRIQQGISLHRLIDQYTDDYPGNRELRLIFKPYYGLYSGAIIDVLFDHFLATDKTVFSPESLMEFSTDVYKMLEPYSALFPEKFSRIFPYMKIQNWLYHYQFHEGIKNSLGGLARRALYISETQTAYRLFEENYDILTAGYNRFFPDLKEMALSGFHTLIQE
jgi:acyl carrier protein phosphodiesterase